MPANLPAVSWGALLPLLLVTGTGLAVLILDPLTAPEHRRRLSLLSLGGLAAAAAAVLAGWGQGAVLFGGMLVADPFARYFTLLFLLVAGLTLLIGLVYLPRTGIDHGEHAALILFATLGMMIMGASRDLMTIFLGLETLSVSLYVLAGLQRERLESNESALKYLLLGAFASGFLLYGIALLYGATGSTNLGRIALALQGRTESPVLLGLGVGLLIVGFGFKVASVPFHMWAPDVYEGAPTSVTAFMITGTKAAAFAALLRILLAALPELRTGWAPVLWLLAALSMTVGNLAALTQPNLKRMLAYSSIAHAGYILVALVAGTPAGGAGLLFYLAAYACMNLGAFAVIVALSRGDGERLAVEQYAGLGLRHPALGAAMALFMFSLAGVPPTGGFMGKLYVFGAAIQADYVGLAVLGVLNSVVSAFYYLRVTVVMYMTPPDPATPGAEPLPPALLLAILLAAAGTLLLGLLPARVFAAALGAIAAGLG